MANTVFGAPLPDGLLPYKARIESTVKPYIEIKATEAGQLPLWQCKFGGLPYLPKGSSYPKGSDGQPLFLLAQINFAEIPRLEGFPDVGMLEFYISGTDGIFGMSHENPTAQANFRVQYFPNVVEDQTFLETDFDLLPGVRPLPLNGTCALAFGRREAPISITDYQFQRKILSQDSGFPWSDEMEAIYRPYDKLFRSAGHKIGGYPFFTQGDPRSENRYGDYVLLFQMDSDSDVGILWSDTGVGNFFIREPDLLTRDFSRVLYYWDSY